jgi:putative phage-type endonuclease
MKELNYSEFLIRRKKYLGGSDISSIFQDNKYSSPLKVYTDKLSDEINDTQTLRTRVGSDLESYVASLYEEKTGNITEIDETLFVHPEHKFAAANIDRWVNNREFILECKTIETNRYYSLMQYSNHEFPTEWLYQVAWYCFVLDKPRADIAALIGFSDFQIHTYERDLELEEMILKKAHSFWHDHVLKMIPPPVIMDSDLLIKHPNDEKEKDKVIKATAEMYNLYKKIIELDKSINIMEKEKKDLILILKDDMGSYDTLHDLNGNKIATHKIEKQRDTFDTKKLKNKFPEAYEACLKEKKPLNEIQPVFRLNKSKEVLDG